MSDVVAGSNGPDAGFLYDLALKGLTGSPVAVLSAIQARVNSVGEPVVALMFDLSILTTMYGLALVKAEGSRAAAIAWLERAGMRSDILGLGGDLPDE